MTDGAFTAAAEEAGRLVDALGQWLAGLNLSPGTLADHLAGGSADCRLCPLCQLLGLLRTSRPEIVAHLEDATASLLAAARLAVESAEAGRPPRPAGFERIDIG